VTTRRNVLLAGGVGTLLVASPPSRSQLATRTPRIGMLWSTSLADSSLATNRSILRQRLAALGYVDGRNVVVEERSADGNLERLDELARDLVSRKVDVIVAQAVTASFAARKATSTIPIVMVNAGDAVGAGLIASLAQPGGNVTGTTNLSFGSKQVELMRELLPHAVKLAALLNPSNANARRYVADVTEAGRRFSLGIAFAEVTRQDQFAAAFAMIRTMRPDGLVVMTEPLIGSHRAEVIAFAAGARLPASYDNAAWVRDGGLVSYGPVYAEHYLLAAAYVDRILRGAKPASLPVEQPSKFELIVNMKTAKALGLAIPPSFIVRAEEVIE